MRFLSRAVSFFAAIAFLIQVSNAQIENRASYVKVGDTPLYTNFVDNEFPFFEATLDLRDEPSPELRKNVAPRAVVLPLGQGYFAAFDTELLRLAAIWKGDYPSLEGLAMKSYANPLNKAGGGFSNLSKPQGKLIAATGPFPGWQIQNPAELKDPRTLFTDPREIGRGPIETGSWQGIEDLGDHALLRYALFNGNATERFSIARIGENTVVRREIDLEGIDTPITLIAKGYTQSQVHQNKIAQLETASIAPNPQKQSLRIDYFEDGRSNIQFLDTISEAPKKTAPHWPTAKASGLSLGKPQGAYAVDEIELPYPNPWQRRIRPSDIAFFPNGDALVLTFDGDVYRISNLNTLSEQTHWVKIAAGFNEPQSICIRGDEIFVFSRLGITRLVDGDGDGETDFYEMFCNQFVQSPGTRDFASSIVCLEDGSFLISKGGQQSEAKNPHSGRVLKISADGKQAATFASGLRNGFLAIDPQSGVITSSDQQGHWIPSTPFHLIEEGNHYGHDKSLPTNHSTISEPKLWIPHHVAQSGLGQIMGFDERAGPLNGSCLYINYHRPSVLRLNIPSPDAPQSSGGPLSVTFETPILKGAINPQDGLPYLVGFQIWGSIGTRIEGISRLRTLDVADLQPIRAEPFKNGILLSFNSELPTTATDVNHYEVRAWNYLRTRNYGSPPFTMEDAHGTNDLPIHAVFLSNNRRSVFIAITDTPKAMQIEVRSNLYGEKNSIYTTVNQFLDSPLTEYGFQEIDFPALFSEPPPPKNQNAEQHAVSSGRGQEVYIQLGCVGCHSIDGSKGGKTGPSWHRLYGSSRELTNGQKITADETYLRESILDPVAKRAIGYDGPEAGMPPYRGILSDEDVESIILFIKSLK